MKASGFIVLLLAALLVAMPAAAITHEVVNGADASILGTKINAQEEVGGTLTAESMAARAVEPIPALALLTTIWMADRAEGSEQYVAYYIDGRYKPTPGAGGDGPSARHY